MSKSQAYSDQVADKYNLQAEMGKYVQEGAVAEMAKEIRTDMEAQLHGRKVSVKSMNKNLDNLVEDKLKAYGVSNLILEDTNHNGKVDDSDRLKMTVTEKQWYGAAGQSNKEFSIGSKWSGPFEYAENKVNGGDIQLTIGSGASVSEEGSIPDGRLTAQEKRNLQR